MSGSDQPAEPTEPGARRPLWQRIRDDLTRDIAAGVLEMGAPVPPVRELAARYGAGHQPVQRALGELQHRGLIHVEIVDHWQRYVVIRLPDVTS